jgi:c-di-GMP-binding flagellar brake protein YcgR
MEQEGHASDRRKYSRIGTDQVISFAPVDAKDYLAVSRNLSAGGLRFEALGCEIEMGDVIRVTFNLADQTVVAIGKVVWATETDPLTLDVGLEFIEIDPAALHLLEQESESFPTI